MGVTKSDINLPFIFADVQAERLQVFYEFWMLKGRKMFHFNQNYPNTIVGVINHSIRSYL